MTRQARPHHHLGRFDRLEDRVTPVMFIHVNMGGNDSGMGTLRGSLQQFDPDPVRVIVFDPAFQVDPTDPTQNTQDVEIATQTPGDTTAVRVTGQVVIYGGGHVIRAKDGASGFSLFTVASGASLTLSDVTVSGASNFSGPGGAIDDAGRLTLKRCLLTGNQAFEGGAVTVEPGATAALTNCTFVNNSAGSDGGALSNSGNTTATFCTFVGNSSDGGGQAVRSDGDLRLVDSILSGGGAQIHQLAGSVDASAPNIIDGTVSQDGGSYNSGGVRQADPLLGDLADNGGPTPTLAPLPGSPALRTGAPAGGSADDGTLTDARGVGRDPAAPDLGAYEVQHPLSPVGVPPDEATLFGPHPSAGATEALVKGLYQAVLLRPGSPAEVQQYVNALNAGQVTASQVARNFYNSPENRSNQVLFFYRYFLHREPSQQEVDFYVAALQSGIDEGVIMQNFILSPEFTGQNDDPQFVTTMYYAVLGRGASQQEINQYVSALQGGQVTRRQVVLNFLRSPESIDRVVQSDYVAYLKRYGEPGPTGVDGWVAQIQGGATFGSIAGGILGSQEFFADAGNNL